MLRRGVAGVCPCHPFLLLTDTAFCDTVFSMLEGVTMTREQVVEWLSRRGYTESDRAKSNRAVDLAASGPKKLTDLIYYVNPEVPTRRYTISAKNLSVEQLREDGRWVIKLFGYYWNLRVDPASEKLLGMQPKKKTERRDRGARRIHGDKEGDDR